MNLCVCCGKGIPEGIQVCSGCIDIAKEDRLKLATITLKEIDHEIKQTKHRLYDLQLRRKIFEKAVRL
jgi:hypothetical protein